MWIRDRYRTIRLEIQAGTRYRNARPGSFICQENTQTECHRLFLPAQKGRRGKARQCVRCICYRPVSYTHLDPSTENPNARFPRLTYGENVNNNRPSSFWLADAGYLRLKTLEIGYTIPKKILSKINMSNLRISVLGDNSVSYTHLDVYKRQIHYTMRKWQNLWE